MPENPYEPPQIVNEPAKRLPWRGSLHRIGKYSIGGTLVGLLFAIVGLVGIAEQPLTVSFVGLVVAACSVMGGLSAAVCSLFVGD